MYSVIYLPIYFTQTQDMLMQDPSGFDKDFVIREFRWVTNYLGFDISTMDIVINFFQNFEHVPFHMNIISPILFY
jgi:hypothetical protein